MTSLALRATSRLARRVLDGEVVFFVGAGFSLDSEGNTAQRLIGRLLAGLLAMGTVLAERPASRESAAGLLTQLAQVFGLSAEGGAEVAREPARLMTWANLDRLAREYYNFNEWAVSALGVLSEEWLSLTAAEARQAAARTEQLGSFFLLLVGDKVGLDAPDITVFERLRGQAAARGKALFLDFMGFLKPEIMAGTPREVDSDRVGASYGGRLRPRHHALARLAREGLGRTLVTTNYDLLLEGAYRLAGFLERQPQGALRSNEPEDNVQFSRIAGASHFFAQGAGHRTALLLKIHGCVEGYRDARKSTQSSELQTWLPTMVFTYREIQTWRGDAWSRDLVRTLLRTHTIALCGYSGADPVMHSTFRDVYEEQAALRRVAQAPSPAVEDDRTGNAAVFTFGIAGRRQFHGFEILHAATAAAGLPPRKLAEHPNHIEFHRGAVFPTIDDHFRWLTHCVLRQLQRNALQSRLRPLLRQLLRRECRDREVSELLTRFDELVAGDALAVEAAGSEEGSRAAAARRRRFEQVVGWTWHFLPGLMRELGLAESVDARGGAGAKLRRERTATFYRPVTDHPEWAAWAVVVELGVRALVASLHDAHVAASAWSSPFAEEGSCAVVSFTLTADEYTRSALCVRLGGFERVGARPPLSGAFRRVSYWEFGEKEVPWPSGPTAPCPVCFTVGPVSRLSRACPAPEELWGWATGAIRPTRSQALAHLGAP